MSRSRRNFSAEFKTKHETGKSLSVSPTRYRYRSSKSGMVYDITYIPMKHGFLYLAVIIDWYSRCIVGWDIE